MYLKALELQGFKSFPDKTVLRFDKPVTAIVGPNGSGKSNISDALLWVMGEQRSRALRGGKMEDVVFGGTEKRSPMGFAQVSLVLDNSQGLFAVDSPELTITRRYYRSGESEYYVNRESVRLKDVLSLLMDTGLGRDGYSVIGQGRIAEIVSAKSTDRREIFEEAAGIARFRSRKEEAERKLERTEENLLRINDKIDELELQVGPLEQQAETAKRYLLLRDEQRGLEISVWMATLDKLHGQSEDLARDFAGAQGNLEAAQAALAAIYAAAENDTQRMQELDVAAEQIRSLQSAEEHAAAEAERAAAVLQSGLDHDRETGERLRDELEAQTRRLDSLEAQAEQQRTRIAAIGAELESLGAERARLEQEAEASAVQADSNRESLSALLAEESGCGDALTKGETELSVRREQGAELAARRESLEAEAAAGRERRAKLASQLAEAEAHHAAAGSRTAELSAALRDRREAVALREQHVRDRSAELGRLTVEKRSAEGRIRLLSDMEKEYEGMGKAVKQVMLAAGRGGLRGVRGPVAKLLSVPDEYTIAIETALGAAMQHIVVDSQQDGKAAIEYLQRADAGRATFLPADTIRPAWLSQPPKGAPGYLGVAVELVHFDPAYAGVFGSLLGRTVVAETLADAVQMSRRAGNRLRIVTLDGQMIHAGGSMTGGSAARNVGILSRANELKRLRIRFGELAAGEKAAAERLSEAERSLTRARLEAEETAGQLQEATERQHRAESARSQLRVLLDTLDAGLAEQQREGESLSAGQRENAQRVSALEAQTQTLRARLAALRKRIEAATQGGADFDQVRERLRERLAALRERAAALESERETAGRSLSDLQSLLGSLSGDGEQRRKALEDLARHSAELERELESRQETVEAHRRQAQAHRAELAEKQRARLELEGRRVRRDRQGQEKNREMLELQSICARLEQKKLAAELEERQIVDRLWESYELSRSAAQALRQPVENLSAATKRIAELRRDIGRLGSVNLGAIAEYERVRERYDFLRSQRDDVATARRDLLKIIADLTGEMREIFLREFQAIAERFRGVFLELFGGGRAALELEDPEQPLDCGIEIRVQPPGKAVTTISLLSGGEKSFVAICLYFAIMKVRPTPFCVMDEVDAALDEANVERCARYMRGMADRTQFITITHHRATMEEADVLYGVTMQEKGVTTVLAMDLEEAEKTIQNRSAGF